MSSSGTCHIPNYDFQIYMEEISEIVDETTGERKFNFNSDPAAYVSMGEGIGNLRADTKLQPHLNTWIQHGGRVVKVDASGRETELSRVTPGDVASARDFKVYGDGVVTDAATGKPLRAVKRTGSRGQDVIAINSKAVAEFGQFDAARQGMEVAKINTTVRSVDKAYQQFPQQFGGVGKGYSAEVVDRKEANKGTKDYTINTRFRMTRRREGM